MANLLFVGAEFDSYDNFNRAIAQYCQTTQVNGEFVKFVKNAKCIKIDKFPKEKREQLIYSSLSGRCKWYKNTGCAAGFTLMLCQNGNGEDVLRLTKFLDAHNNHAIIAPINAPQPNGSNVSNVKMDKLQLVMTNILEHAKKMPEIQRNAVVDVLENLSMRMEENIMYKVDFTDFATEIDSDSDQRVSVAHVESPSERSERRKAKMHKSMSARALVQTITISSGDDDDDDGDKNTVQNRNVEQSSQNQANCQSIASPSVQSTEPEKMSTVSSLDRENNGNIVVVLSDSESDCDMDSNNNPNGKYNESSDDSTDDESEQFNLSQTNSARTPIEGNEISDESSDASKSSDEYDEFQSSLFNSSNELNDDCGMVGISMVPSNNSRKAADEPPQIQDKSLGMRNANHVETNSKMGSPKTPQTFPSETGSGKKRLSESEDLPNKRASTLSRRMSTD